MGCSGPGRTLAAFVTNLKTVTDADTPRKEQEVVSPCDYPTSSIDEIRPLFDGSSFSQIRNNTERVRVTATAADGICCYRQCLLPCSSEAKVMRTIHVVPGHIEKYTTPYDFVSDGLNKRWETSSNDVVVLGEVDSSDPKYKPIGLDKLEIKALAFDSPIHRQLHFYYKVILPGGAIQKIAPGNFTEQVLRCAGLLTCFRGGKCRKQLCTPAKFVRRGWAIDADHQDLIYNAAVALCLWSYDDDLARCVAFDRYTASRSFEGGAPNVFLRGDECLPCISQFILREASRILQRGNRGVERDIVHVI